MKFQKFSRAPSPDPPPTPLRIIPSPNRFGLWRIWICVKKVFAFFSHFIPFGFALSHFIRVLSHLIACQSSTDRAYIKCKTTTYQNRKLKTHKYIKHSIYPFHLVGTLTTLFQYYRRNNPVYFLPNKHNQTSKHTCASANHLRCANTLWHTDRLLIGLRCAHSIEFFHRVAN